MTQIDLPVNAHTVMLDNIEAIMGCVKNGLGFTLLPAPDVQRYSHSEIVEFSAPNDIRRSLILMTQSANMLAKRLELLAAQFGTPLPTVL